MSSVQDYMRTLPDESLNELYSNPYTCQTVFRSLPSLAQQFVMRMLYVKKGLIRKAHLQGWVKQEFVDSECSAQLQTLLDLRVLMEKHSEKSAETGYRVNPMFQQNLLSALACIDNTADNSLPPKQNDPTIAKVNECATERWERIIHHMIDPTKSGMPQASGHVITELFTRMGVIESSGHNRVVTSLGYKYLMGDMYAQAWQLILAYIDYAPSQRGLTAAEILTFLFQLGFHELGKPYSMEGFSNPKRSLLEDLALFGLAYRQPPSRRYYPTKLAVNLSSRQAASQDPGFIFLESNYKVYAFTGSPVQLARLRVFCMLEYHLPQLIVARITRESCIKAFDMGITSTDIITFLTTNAHPKMCDHEPIVPVAISEQIELWEREMSRVSYDAAFSYEDFDTRENFELTKAFAKQHGVLLCCNDQQMVIVVQQDPAKHELIKAFISQLGRG